MIQPTSAQQVYPQGGGANAVSINIYNPQAYGSNPMAAQNTQQAVPYNYTNSLYQMPQASNYVQGNIQPGAYQQFMPVQVPMMQPQMPMMQPQMPANINQQVVAPAPQMMPQSVMEQPQVQQPTQEVQQQPTQEAQQAQQAVQEVQAQTEPAQPQAPAVNVDELIQGLQEKDADKKAETINKIAAYAQEKPEIALQIVSEPMMNALVNVIKEDTTQLEGPTDKQIEIAEKITKGEKLTPEEDALAEQLSPRDKANKNRIFALYTLAMIQKLQREELNDYIESQKANGETPIDALKVQDLVGYNDVVNVIQNDQRPEVRVAAIQALEHVSEPSDKETVQGVLDSALKSEDEIVKAAANEAIAKVGGEAPAQEAGKAEDKK